jgi:hypothetical protein
MPVLTDANGWPTADAVAAKMITAVERGDISGALFDDIVPTLAAVIAEFQSPPPIGTGRQFTPVVEPRSFDGNGRTEIQVPDIVPGSAITVTLFNVALADAVLKTNYRGEGTTTIVRDINSYGGPYNNLQGATFIVGHQNVRVTTTWGAGVTAAIYDAIACEAARRASRSVAGWGHRGRNDG